MEKQPMICDCGHTAVSSGIGTGYGTDEEGKTYCYACCAENDKQWMREHGKITLYLSDKGITNWPGSLIFPIKRLKKSKHMVFGRSTPREDVWFEFEGELWHGVQRGGNNQICRCVRGKRKTKYYVGTVEERYGEYESKDTFVFAVRGNQDVAKVAARLAREWRGLEPDSEGSFWFDGNLHGPIEYREIPKKDFMVLKRYLSDIGEKVD